MIKNEINISNEIIQRELKKILNQIYKLLPMREEKLDWKISLSTVIEELAGMSRLLFDQQDTFFPLLCKLEGLFTLDKEEDFFFYRRTIFDCIGLVNNLTTLCQV